MAPSFIYTPLPSKTHTRLIQPLPSLDPSEVSFTLTSHDLSSPSSLPPFTALSYTWGSPYLNPGPDPSSPSPPPQTATDDPWDKATHPVLCNGATLLVRPNLLNALRMLCFTGAPREERVWIDAICIDQASVQEREDQVKMMGEIYGRAEGVLAWLGAEDEFTEAAAGVVGRLASLGRVCGGDELESERQKYDWITSADLLEPEAYEKLGIEFITIKEWRAWFGLVLRPYFRRMWIVQEILKARKLDLVIGHTMIPWGDFERAVHFLEAVRAWGGDRIMNEVMLDILSPEGDEIVDTWKLVLSMLRFGVRRHAPLALGGDRNGDDAELDVLLEKHRDTQASDARDKVYALLGLTEGATNNLVEDLAVDYKVSVEAVYTRTARYVSRLRADLRIFGHREPSSDRKITSLPSWVPDFTVKHGGGAMGAEAGGSDGWMASGGEMWEPDSRLLGDPELLVRGRLVGIVESVCQKPLFRGRSEDLCKGWRDLLRLLLDFSCHTNKQPQGPSNLAPSHPRVSSLDLLARTFTRDTFRGVSPAPSADLANQFLNFVIYQYLSSYGKLETTDEARQIWEDRRLQLEHTQFSQLDDSSSIGDLLSVAVRCEPEDSSYGWDMFMRRLEEIIKYSTRVSYAYFGNRRQPATKEKILELELGKLEQGDFTRQAKHSLASRTVFSTRSGEMLGLGLGPADVVARDEVWVLNGAKTPVVLRKVGEGRYEFLGEAYVHGMMHGEALERFLDVEDIVMV